MTCYLSARVGTGIHSATCLPQLCTLGEVDNLASLAQRVPDESVSEHQELSPGTPESRFHHAAGATVRSVARPHLGLDQVAMHLLGLLYISRQRPAHNVFPYCPLRFRVGQTGSVTPVSWYIVAPSFLPAGWLPAEWPAQEGDTQISNHPKGWLAPR